MPEEAADRTDSAVRVAPIEVEITYSAHVGVRTYRATQHLWSARHSARQARDIEERNAGTGRRSIELQAAVTNAVFMSVAFIEASINEVLQDIADSAGGRLADSSVGFGEASVTRLRESWKGPNGLHRERTLDKYEITLSRAGCPPLDKGANPFQAAKKLIKLRNALVHFKPEWQMDDEEHDLAKSLKGLFAESSIHYQPVDPWYPSMCLSAGCAEWAHTSALALVGEWSQKFGLARDFEADLESFPPPGDGPVPLDGSGLT